jgi:hypothetical protein
MSCATMIHPHPHRRSEHALCLPFRCTADIMNNPRMHESMNTFTMHHTSHHTLHHTPHHTLHCLSHHTLHYTLHHPLHQRTSSFFAASYSVTPPTPCHAMPCYSSSTASSTVPHFNRSMHTRCTVLLNVNSQHSA